MAEPEQVLSRPVRGQVKPKAASRTNHTSANLEQSGADCGDAGMGQRGSSQHGTAEVGHHSESQGVHLQSECVGPKSMAAESIGTDIELEFFDEVLGRTALVILAQDS